MMAFAHMFSTFFIADGCHAEGTQNDQDRDRSPHLQRSEPPDHNARHDSSSMAEDPVINTHNAARQYAKQSTSSYNYEGPGKVVNTSDLDDVDSPTIGSQHMDTDKQQDGNAQGSVNTADHSQNNAESNAEQIASMLNQDAGGDRATQMALLQRQVDENKDQMLRAVAEMENLRRRTERERSDLLRYGAMGLAKDILAVVDNMYRALDLVRDSQGIDQALVDGLKMVLQQLDTTLAQHNIMRIAVNPGDPLDPQQHQAMAEEPSNQFPAGRILRVLSSGYTMHDRLLRPVQVMVVARDSASSHDQNNEANNTEAD